MKRVIVVGDGSGIGRGLAELLLQDGQTVGIAGRREQALRDIAEENPGKYRYTTCDVTDPEAAAGALESLAGELGGMELCIVAAGTGDQNPGLEFTGELPVIRNNVQGWTAVVD